MMTVKAHKVTRELKITQGVLKCPELHRLASRMISFGGISFTIRKEGILKTCYGLILQEEMLPMHNL